MKVILIGLIILNIVSLCAVTAEELYGNGFAYHTHTAYGMKNAR